MANVTEGRAADRNAETGRTIEGALFSRYAETDLDRWRALIGGEVVHVDSRWGAGRVEDVRRGTCCDHVAPYIQVRVRYADHGIVVFRARPRSTPITGPSRSHRRYGASSGPATKKSEAKRSERRSSNDTSASFAMREIDRASNGPKR